MLTGIDIDEIVEYTSPKDKGETKTVFKLGVIPTTIMATVKDKMRVQILDIINPDGKASTRVNLGEMHLEYIRFGLKGWTNFKNKKGKELPFETEERQVAGTEVKIVSEKTINLIPDPLIVELATEIQNLNTLTEQERKNSV